jgi:hypothetical protein
LPITNVTEKQVSLLLRFYKVTSKIAWLIVPNGFLGGHMSSSLQAFREIVIGMLVAIAILIVAGQRHPAHAVVIFNFTGTCDVSATTCARENLELGGAVSGFMALDDAAAIPGQMLTPDNFTDYRFEFGRRFTFQHGPRPLDFDVIYDPHVGTLDNINNGISLNATATGFVATPGFEGPGQFIFRFFPEGSFLAAITVESDGTTSWFLGGEVFPDGTPGGAGMFEAVSIPEPPTVILLIFGFMAALLFSRHKPTHKLIATEQR